MISRKTLKAEIDKVQDKYLEALHKIIQAFEKPEKRDALQQAQRLEWRQFIDETYGCLADAPIDRGEQGEFESRVDIK